MAAPSKRSIDRDVNYGRNYDDMVDRAELSLCSTMLWDRSTCMQAVAALEADDFANHQARGMFRVWLDVFRKTGVPNLDFRQLIDPMAQLPQFGDRRAVLDWFIGLARGDIAVPHPSYTEHNLSVIRAAAQKRRAQVIVQRVSEGLGQGDLTPDDVRQARDALTEAVEIERRLLTEIEASVAEVRAHLESPRAGGELLSTGLFSLDGALGGGFRRGEAIIIAAPTGGGKSALATQIAAHHAENGRSVFLVSLEMSHSDLTARIVCGRAGIQFVRWKKRSLDLIGRQDFERSAAEVERWKLGFCDAGVVRVDDIFRSASAWKKRYGLDMLVVDYLQLVTPDETRFKNRQEQVAQISRDLKKMARDLACPVLLLSQLKRPDSENAKPKLSDLRESGSLEQDADTVIMIHGANGGKQDDVAATIMILKQRSGPQCDVAVSWSGPTMTFSDLQYEEPF